MQDGYVKDDDFFMRQALCEAKNAFHVGEIPVGAVLVSNNKIIARAHNQVEKLNDPTAHAEILAITSACSFLGAKYLPGCTLYVTLEPCHMCAGALYWSKLDRIVFGAADAKNGFRKFFGETNPFHPKTEIKFGLLAEQSTQLMKEFFRQRR
ncbi:MAG: nucleoside deaminase [Segetibacter sp.]|nr:nucleoside deaminase [Segetibacter sp.]